MESASYSIPHAGPKLAVLRRIGRSLVVDMDGRGCCAPVKSMLQSSAGAAEGPSGNRSSLTMNAAPNGVMQVIEAPLIAVECR